MGYARLWFPLTCGVALLAGCGTAASSSPSSSRTTSSHGLERSIKGQLPGERPSDARLDRAACAALRAAAEREGAGPLRAVSEPTPPLSSCRLLGPGVSIAITLDSAYGARVRYQNRVVETAQFGAPDPARIPHPVAGVGDPRLGAGGANWVPGISTLLAVRGRRWVTVDYSAAGHSRPRRLAAASALARDAFQLSAPRAR